MLRDAPGIRQTKVLGQILDAKCSVYRDMPVPRASLVSLLEVEQSLEATEPGDRVFSLIGLTNLTLRSQRLPIELKPDYNKTEAAVFALSGRGW
jgi:hypothetical protein